MAEEHTHLSEEQTHQSEYHHHHHHHHHQKRKTKKAWKDLSLWQKRKIMHDIVLRVLIILVVLIGLFVVIIYSL